MVFASLRASGIDLGEWRRAIRDGRCEFDIRGYSHVFVPTAGDHADCTDVSEVPDAPNAFQETYGRPALKKLLQAYWQNHDTRDQRREAGADYLAQESEWKPPGAGGTDMPFITNPERPPPPAPDASLPKAPQSPESDSKAARRTQPDVQPDVPAEVYRWLYPSIGQLLSTSFEKADEADQQEWLTRLATATKSALQQMQLQAKLLESAMTPNSALLKFAGSANMTVDQVLRRRSELLTTFGLNVISVRPEPGAVVVAIERPEREVVNTQQIWSLWRPATTEWGNQDILIGVRENDGTQLFLLSRPQTCTSHLDCRQHRKRQVGTDAKHHPRDRCDQYTRAGQDPADRPEAGRWLLCLRGSPAFGRRHH